MCDFSLQSVRSRPQKWATDSLRAISAPEPAGSRRRPTGVWRYVFARERSLHLRARSHACPPACLDGKAKPSITRQPSFAKSTKTKWRPITTLSNFPMGELYCESCYVDGV